VEAGGSPRIHQVDLLELVTAEAKQTGFGLFEMGAIARYTA